MAVDDSFKKPGSIPFKWEIQPGVPKRNGSDLLQLPNRIRPDPFYEDEEEEDQYHSRQPLHTPRMLRPPPAGRLYYQPDPETRTRSFRSAPRTRSERLKFHLSGITRSVGASGSGGCLPSPLLKRALKLRNPKTLPEPGPVPEPEFCLDLETPPRWSVSSRRSFSPFSGSPVSSYFSSPRPVSDA